jgi:hypothetical protein
MARFVETVEGKLLNTDHIVEVCAATGDVVMLGGAHHKLAMTDPDRGVFWFAPEIVPAAPGTQAYVVTGPTDNFRSDPQRLRVVLTWVVAWEIGPSQSRETFPRQFCAARAIVADKIEQNSEVLVVQPDGRLRDQHGFVYPDIEDAKAQIVKRPIYRNLRLSRPRTGNNAWAVDRFEKATGHHHRNDEDLERWALANPPTDRERRSAAAEIEALKAKSKTDEELANQRFLEAVGRPPWSMEELVDWIDENQRAFVTKPRLTIVGRETPDDPTPAA